MNIRRRTLVLATSLMALAMPFAQSAAQAQDDNLKKVSVRLAFSYNGHRSPYLLGVDKGFYEDAGLDVEVLEGKGVTSSMQLVASGQDTFAIIDPPSLMLGYAQGMPLKIVAQLYQISPNALISWKDAAISSPEDLKAKTVATLQGDTTTTMLYALLARNGIERGDVNIVATDGGTRNQTFLAKRATALTGFSNDSYLSMKGATDDQVDYFMYSNFGIDTMGDALAANTDTIENDPELVDAFVKATLKAYAYALEHPQEAIDSLIARSPTRDPEVAVEKLKATAGLMTSPVTEEHGIGYADKAAYEQTQELMSEFGGLSKTVDDVSVYYTNDFLPKN